MSSHPNPIRVGVVGLSTIGWGNDAIGPALLSTPYYKLTAISNTSIASATAAAETYGALIGHHVKAYHGSTAQIAADPDVDMVIVCVRAPSHKDAAVPVIEAGKDLFIEWPSGKNLEETLELADLVRKKGVRAMVGLQAKFSPVVNKVKEIIESGKIGKVLSTSIISLSPRSLHYWGSEIWENCAYTADEANGATILDIGVGHQIIAFTHMLGEFASVSATSATMYPVAKTIDTSGKHVGSVTTKTADHFAVSGMLKSGAIASLIWRSGLEETPGRTSLSWTIDGENGSILMEGSNSFLNVVEPKLTLNGQVVEVETTDMFVGNVRASMEDFAKGKEGKGMYPTFEDAIKNKKLLDAIRKSAKEGRRVVL